MSAADKLRHQLGRYHALRQHQEPDGIFTRRLRELQAFQVRRLQHTHADLIADPVFHDATELFLTDIYGGIDLLPMAREIERALPIATRLLPDSVLETSAIATEAMTLTQELDECLTALLFETRGIIAITFDNYAAAFRDMGRFEDRMRQLDLARQLGYGLDRYVRSRFVYATFRIASRPAHKYGLGILYDFLDRGFRVMRPMGSAHELFERLANAEKQIVERIAAGTPDPFQLKGKPLAWIAP